MTGVADFRECWPVFPDPEDETAAMSCACGKWHARYSIEPDRLKMVEWKMHAARVLLGECVCNTGPSIDGPEEDCPQHGRPYKWWVRQTMDYAAAAQINARMIDQLQEELDLTIEMQREALHHLEAQDAESLGPLATALRKQGIPAHRVKWITSKEVANSPASPTMPTVRLATAIEVGVEQEDGTVVKHYWNQETMEYLSGLVEMVASSEARDEEGGVSLS